MTLTTRPWRRALVASMLLLAGSCTWAFGDKPFRIVVPAPAGGAIDVIARVLGEQLSKDLHQPVVIDNKPGAGGGIGIQAMLSAPADGQTFMITASNVLTEIPLVMKTSYDPLKDVRPVYAVARLRNILVSSPNLPAQDFKSLIAYLKATPGKYSYASHSPGTASHYAGLYFAQKGGLDLQHVPFAGAPPALAQVMGEQVTLLFDSFATSAPLVAAGKLRAYGVGGATRHPNLPQVPTFTELGHPELDYANWFGVVVSSKVPADAVDSLNRAVHKAADVPAVRDRITGLGFEMLPPQSSSQLAQSVREEHERNAAIVKKFNITP